MACYPLVAHLERLHWNCPFQDRMNHCSRRPHRFEEVCNLVTLDLVGRLYQMFRLRTLIVRSLDLQTVLRTGYVAASRLVLTVIWFLLARVLAKDRQSPIRSYGFLDRDR